jgi:hypothetical protein
MPWKSWPVAWARAASEATLIGIAEGPFLYSAARETVEGFGQGAQFGSRDEDRGVFAVFGDHGSVTGFFHPVHKIRKVTVCQRVPVFAQRAKSFTPPPRTGRGSRPPRTGRYLAPRHRPLSPAPR